MSRWKRLKVPRPSETREPTEILKEFEGSVKALRELLENSPELFELNMGLSIAQGLQKTSGKLETDRKQIETDDF